VLGNIPDSFWRGQTAHIGSIKQTAGIERFWKARKGVFAVEFCEFVDALQNSADIPTGHELNKILRNETSTEQVVADDP
jgi:hypothetical protein